MTIQLGPESTIFVVLDPTRMVQPALERAEIILRRSPAKLHLFCCTYDADFAEAKDHQQAVMAELSDWVERLATRARDDGRDVTTQVDWQEDWRSAIVVAAAAADASLVIKTASRHSALGRRFLRTSDWTLLRECHCPTLLVSDRSRWDRKAVLAAVKVDPENATYDQLNKDVLAVAGAIAEGAGFDLHAVAAYRGEALLDRQRFADAVGLPRNRVQAGEGTPHEVIAQAAGDIGAAVVVVGSPGSSIARDKLSKAHTAHWLIDHVDTDVFVVPARA